MADTKTCKMYLGDTLISGGVSGNEHTWNQIPTAVKNFLDNVTYNPSDYTTSQIGNYAPSTENVDNTYPVGITVETSSGVLDRNGYEMSVGNGNATLYNDIPNQYTEYVVRNGGVVSQVGTLRPTGFLRQIKSSTQNVRDLGGWNCDGGTVKYGKLFRGGEILNADKDLFVKQLGIRHELNLRGKSESNGKTVSTLGSEIGYTCTENYIWYTLDNVTDWKTTIRCIFDCVASNKTLYFHCSAGADRTGTVACIIEAILGFSQSDIDKEYELTCFATGTGADSNARRRNEKEWSSLINQINSLTVGGTFNEKVLNWVASLGFTADEINSFRIAMINGNPSEVLLDVESYNITKTALNVMFDNEATTINQYESYKESIKTETGYVIKNISVKMGSVDISASSAYVNMGFTNGMINIENVIGNIEIVVETEKSGYTNLFDSTAEGFSKESDAKFMTNYIPCSKGDVIHIKGNTPYKYQRYSTDKVAIGSLIYCSNAGLAVSTYDSTVKTMIAGQTASDGTIDNAEFGYVRFEVREALAENLIITVNEEIY